MVKLLILEDDENIISILDDLLNKKFDIEITWARDGREGLAIFFRDRVFDLIITDYFMPHMNGVAFTKLLRLENTTIPIIMYSSSMEIEELAKLAGVTKMIYKSDVNDLLDCVQLIAFK